MRQRKSNSGFTLMEVLIALAILAIALTALLKSTSQSVDNTRRIKEKTIAHWVAMQGVAMLQLGLINPNQSIESTQATKMLQQKWYWRARLSPTQIANTQKITILVSLKQEGPFYEELSGYRYYHEQN